VPALRKTLADLQMRMIQESIPSILRDIEREREGARAECKRLGEMLTTPSERRSCFSSVTRKVVDCLKAQQADNSSDIHGKTSVAKQQEHYDAFGREILSKRLNNVSQLDLGVRVVVSKSDGTEEAGKVVSLSADGSKVHVLTDNLATTGLLGKTAVATTVRRALGELRTCNSSTCPMCKNGGRGNACHVTTQLPCTIHVNGVLKPFLPFDVDNVSRDSQWLETLISDNRNNDLSCFLSAALFNSIVAGMVKADWAPLCEALVADTCAALQLCITQAFTDVMPERFPATVEYVSDCVAEVCEECLAAAQEHVSAVLAENLTPYTQNHYLFEIINKKRNEKLRRSIVRSFSPDTTYHGANMIAVVDAAFSKNAKKSMLQHVAEEMQIVLDAYGKVADKRIIDDVPMAAQRMTRTILLKIETRLMDVTDDTLKRIMRDQPKFEEEQRRAVEKVGKMDRAHKAVRKLREL